MKTDQLMRAFLFAILLVPLHLQAQPAEREGVVPGEIIVQFQPGRSDQEFENLRQQFGAEVIRRLERRPDLVLFRVPEATSAIVNAIERNPNVRFAQFNYTYELAATPNDPLFSQQWGLSQANDVDIDATEAWSFTTGSSQLTIATLDTGADFFHPDLAGRLVAGWDFANNEADVQDMVTNSHGTHVAGIIGARGNNSLGVSGTMWSSSLLIVQLFGNAGPPFFVPHCGLAPATTDQVVDAIDFAVDNGAKIVNGSFASSANSVIGDQAVRQAINNAGSTTLFVVAAGNFQQNIENNPRFPCAWDLDNIICVAAVDAGGNLWDDPAIPPGQSSAGSSYGVVSVDLGAPGVNILSTARSDCTRAFDPDPLGENCSNVEATACEDTTALYRSLTGTSMSTAFVSGVAGLVMSGDPEVPGNPKRSGAAYIRRIKEKILLTAQPIPSGDLDGQTHTGGMVNAHLAIRGFGDSFDSAPVNSHFFTNSPQKDLWAVPQNGIAQTCGVITRQIAGTADRVIEADFQGLQSWTIASYQAAQYEPGSAVQTIVLRASKPDGSAFATPGGSYTAQGRVGAGIIGETGLITRMCSQKNYKQASIGGSAFGGVILDTGQPFMFFDGPFVQFTYPAIDLRGVTKLSIAVHFDQTSASLFISDGSTGEELFDQDNIAFPSNWNFNGTITGVIGYISKDENDAGSGTLHLRSTVTVR